MTRKAIVYKTITGGWCWSHECNGILEPGGYVHQNSRVFSKHQHAFVAAWWHVKACRGRRTYWETRERT